MRTLVVLAALLATPLSAQGKFSHCDVSGQIVDAVVEERVDGATKKKAVRRVSRNLNGDQKPFKEAVGPIADWVYSISPDDMGPEVSKAYVTICQAQ